jgi:hypothetical protein
MPVAFITGVYVDILNKLLPTAYCLDAAMDAIAMKFIGRMRTPKSVGEYLKAEEKF